MLHGNGGNYTEWSDSYLPEQADRMIAAGEIPPLIIVMPDDAESTYWANWSEGPRWADYVAEDVVSTMDQRYRTLPDPRSRAVGGMSMGGLGALNLAFQRPDVFGVVGGHSPSVRLKPDPALWFLVGDNFWEHNPVWLAQNRDGLENVQIWLDAGTDDVWLPNIKAVRDALVDRGVRAILEQLPRPARGRVLDRARPRLPALLHQRARAVIEPHRDSATRTKLKFIGATRARCV